MEDRSSNVVMIAEVRSGLTADDRRGSWALRQNGASMISSGVPVEEVVLKGGAPYALTPTKRIAINLQGEDGKASGGADVSPDGSFRVRSAAGGDMLPGKYKVSYTHYGLPGAKSGSAPPTKTVPATWEVTGTAKAFTLDIATGVSKK